LRHSEERLTEKLSESAGSNDRDENGAKEKAERHSGAIVPASVGDDRPKDQPAYEPDPTHRKSDVYG